MSAVAFEKQSQEVGDQVQSSQLEEQEKTNAELVKVLKLQAEELSESLEERKRDAERHHQAQSSRVFITEDCFGGRIRGQGSESIGGIGMSPPSITAKVQNTSDQPTHDAELRWHRSSEGHGEPNPEPVGPILPGETVQRKRSFPSGTNMP